MSFTNEESSGMSCTTSVTIAGRSVTLDIHENQLIPVDMPVFPRRILARMLGIYQLLREGEAGNKWLDCDAIHVSMPSPSQNVVVLELVFLKALTMDLVAAIYDENIELFRNSRPCYWSNISYENRTMRQVAVTNDIAATSKVLRLTATFYGEKFEDDRVYGAKPTAFRNSLERFATLEPSAASASNSALPESQVEQKITAHLKTKHFGEQPRLATIEIVSLLRQKWPDLTFSVDRAVNENFVATLSSARMLYIGADVLDRIHRTIKDRGLEREVNVYIGTLACLDSNPYTPDNVAAENEKMLEAAGINTPSSGRPVKRAVRKILSPSSADVVSDPSCFMVRIAVTKTHVDGHFASPQAIRSASFRGKAAPNKTVQQFSSNRDPLPDDPLMGGDTLHQYSSTRRPVSSGQQSANKRRKVSPDDLLVDAAFATQRASYTTSSYGRR